MWRQGEVQALLKARADFETPKVMAALLVFIVVSNALILTNNHLLRGGFPYAAALIWAHSATNVLFTRAAYCVSGERLFATMKLVRRDQFPILLRMVPLTLAMVVSMVFSNEAYRFCSIPFLQMCKQFNLVTCYLAGILIGFEFGSIEGAIAVVLVTAGGVLNVHGELGFSAHGFYVQVLSQVGELFRNTFSVWLLSSAGYGLDVMTFLWITSPLCLIVLTWYQCQYWDPKILLAVRETWPVMLQSCVLATAVQVASYALIKYGGMVTFIAAGILKDVVIIAVSALVMDQRMSQQQVIACVLVFIGSSCHAANKMYADRRGNTISTIGKPFEDTEVSPRSIP
jgi:uncharacterized membrane protein